MLTTLKLRFWRFIHTHSEALWHYSWNKHILPLEKSRNPYFPGTKPEEVRYVHIGTSDDGTVDYYASH